jgi:hypothetical protein
LNHNENCIGTGGGKRTRFPCFISEERQIKRESFPFTSRLPNTGITAMKDDFKRFQSKILFWKKKKKIPGIFGNSLNNVIYIFSLFYVFILFFALKMRTEKEARVLPKKKENKFFRLSDVTSLISAARLLLGMRI